MESDEQQLNWVTAGQTVINDLILHQYRKVGLSTAQFMVYLQIKSYLDKGIHSPNIEEIAENLGSDANQVYSLMHQMIQAGFMSHETKLDSAGKQSDYYSFVGLTQKILNLSHLTKNQQATEAVNKTREDVFNQIEVEFGRPLSPIELETVAQWLDQDHYSPDMITLGLQEAVLNQVWSLKYIDRILSSWDRQNIRTPQQVEQYQNNRANQPTEKEKLKPKKKLPKIPMFKVSEED